VHKLKGVAEKRRQENKHNNGGGEKKKHPRQVDPVKPRVKRERLRWRREEQVGEKKNYKNTIVPGWYTQVHR
jgi:hypothetical protein